jgi:hypothetical protein
MAEVIYVPRGSEGVELCHPVDQKDFETINAMLNGHEARSAWNPVCVELISHDSGVELSVSDCPWLGSHALIFRPRVIEFLRKMLEAHGELLPLRCESADLKIYNVTTVIDALDESACSLMRLANGRIFRVNRYAFDSARIRGRAIFKIPNLRVSPTFVTQNFVSAWFETGLSGLSFEEVWREGVCESGALS